MTESCPQPGVDLKTPIDKTLLDACIHCGLCLPACPTYLATGREMESPRGRIYLLTQWNNGELPLTERMAGHIESCLGCFGCQTACPSGVKYESILDQARPYIAQRRPGYQTAALRFAFQHLLPNYRRLRQAAKLLSIWQRSNGRKLLRLLAGVDNETVTGTAKARPAGGFKRIFYKLWECDSLMPEIAGWKPLPRKAWASGEKKGTVQLFAGCVMDVFYNQVNHAAVRLLKAQAQVVEVPDQTCCGALAFHAGETEITKGLARKNINCFQSTEGPIAVTAAGCGAMIKLYGELLASDSAYHEKAQALSARVKDITEVLAENQFTRKEHLGSPGAKKIAYHAACHLAHAQGVREAPAKLLGELAADCNQKSENNQKLEVTPLKEAEHCCGSAGVYNLINTDLSMKVLERKIACIVATGADTLVTTNPGCMLQIQAGLSDRNIDLKVEHLCTILDRVYNPES